MSTKQAVKATVYEKDCCITLRGQEFCASGAVVTDQLAIVYCNKDMTRATTWHGEDLGPMRVTSSWRLDSSCYTSGWMYQVEATIVDKVYTGRTCGGGMIARLKLKRG